MKCLKNKLKNRSGASMILALVFLMFCLCVGGAVLAASTANGSRATNQTFDEQSFLSQRSALGLMAEMLEQNTQGMHLEIRDEVLENGAHALTFTIPSEENSVKNALQRVLYENAVDRYIADLQATVASVSYENFVFENAGDGPYSVDRAVFQREGSIAITLYDHESAQMETHTAVYSNPDSYDLVIELGQGAQNGSNLLLRVSAIQVTATDIYWGDPVIEKGD